MRYKNCQPQKSTSTGKVFTIHNYLQLSEFSAYDKFDKFISFGVTVTNLMDSVGSGAPDLPNDPTSAF